MSGVVESAAAIFGVSSEDILSAKRDAPYCYARFAIMKALRDKGRTFSFIADQIGRTDHKTIMHGVQRAEQIMKRDAAFARAVAHLSYGGDCNVQCRHPSIVAQEKAARVDARRKLAADRERQRRAEAFAALRRNGRTLDWIAVNNGISRERVRQVLKAARFDTYGKPVPVEA